MEIVAFGRDRSDGKSRSFFEHRLREDSRGAPSPSSNFAADDIVEDEHDESGESDQEEGGAPIDDTYADDTAASDTYMEGQDPRYKFEFDDEEEDTNMGGMEGIDDIVSISSYASSSSSDESDLDAAGTNRPFLH
jgi:hypothetical protein